MLGYGFLVQHLYMLFVAEFRVRTAAAATAAAAAYAFSCLFIFYYFSYYQYHGCRKKDAGNCRSYYSRSHFMSVLCQSAAPHRPAKLSFLFFIYIMPAFSEFNREPRRYKAYFRLSAPLQSEPRKSKRLPKVLPRCFRVFHRRTCSDEQAYR